MNNISHSVEERKQRFLDTSRKVHGDLYDYSKVEYVSAQVKVEIVCKVHGSFFQLPDSHRKGNGCRQCGFLKMAKRIGTSVNTKKTTEQFIKEAKARHGDKYDYSKTVYTGKASKLEISCPLHGSFMQSAANHLNGSGCKQCGVEKSHTHFINDTDFFKRASQKIHGDKYDYSVSSYEGKQRPITIRCKIHGDFTLKKAQYHYTTSCIGCPKCVTAGVSSHEKDIADFIRSFGIEVITRDRTLIGPREIDMVIPSLNLAIEYNGIYWHSEGMGKGKNYHINKTIEVGKKGYRLIHIFEDEWLNKKDIVKSRLTHILGKSEEVRYARKLTLSALTKSQVFNFQEETHIQGKCSFSTGLGLFDGEMLVACMTFGRNRFTKEGEVELLRYSTKGNVVGGFSKLLKEFLRKNPEVKSLTSYSDRRWSVGNVYEKNGFKKEGSSAPSYFYVRNNTVERLNRMGFQKHRLSFMLENFDPSLSEGENMRNHGYMRIYDCGTDKWSLKRD